MTSPEPMCWNVWRHEAGRWVWHKRATERDRGRAEARAWALSVSGWTLATVHAEGVDPNELPPGAVWSQVEVLGEPDARA